ncbi:MAG: hypothetical protein IMY88_00080 [Chloroflexi bacterium]|nr:hypothetical protein [Chloroflexota bacterium]
MDKVEVKVTWGLAWSLFWRWFLIQLGIGVIIWIIMFFVGAAFLIPFMGGL